MQGDVCALFNRIEMRKTYDTRARSFNMQNDSILLCCITLLFMTNDIRKPPWLNFPSALSIFLMRSEYF